MSCVTASVGTKHPRAKKPVKRRRARVPDWRLALQDDALLPPDTSQFRNSFTPDGHRRLVDGVDFECRLAGSKGKGVFALTAVEPGAVLTTYTGDVLPERNPHPRTHQLHVRGRRVVVDGLRRGGRGVSDSERFTLQLDGARYVLNDATQGYGAFVNSTQDVATGQEHRELANVRVEFDAHDTAYVVTTKAVKAGQEFLWFYAVTM